MTLSEFFKKIFSGRLWGNCLGMMAAAVLLVVGALVFLHYYTHHGEAITMPDLRGKDAELAVRKLEALGLRGEVADTGYVRSQPGNIVLEQSIAAGEKIKPGRLISLTINSSGSPMVTLPDVADNSSRREAETRLKTLGFKLGAPEYIEGEPDWVYAVKVGGRTMSAGARVSVDQLVTLVIGNGLTEEEFNGNDSLDYLFFGTDDLHDSTATEEVGFEEEHAYPPAEEAGTDYYPENP